MLLNKLTNPVQQMKFQPGIYDDITAGALLVTGGRLLDQLRDATVRVVQHGSYKRTGVLLLVDKDMLESRDCLVEINLCLRSLWAATSVVLKPWADRAGINRLQDGSILTASIPGVADEMSVATSKLAKLLKSSNHLICIHGSGKVVAKGPQAPPTPDLELMMSTEVDTYLRVVQEVDTADEANALWRPGPTKPSQLKRLQQEPKRGKGRRGGFNGQGNGGKRGYVGKHGGRGGYGYSGPVPTVVNSGIHYHCY